MALSIRGASKSFRDRVALHPLDLALSPGEGLALLGPNGSGKTTLLRLAAGLALPTTGEVRAFDLPLSDPSSRHRLGYLPESPPLPRRMRIVEFLRLCARLSGHPADRIASLLDRFELTDRPLAELSRGSRQRVGLVQALLHRPALLLLDEPLTGLDEEGRAIAVAAISEAISDGAAAVVATHWPAAFPDLGRTATLRGGRLAKSQ